MNKMMELFLLVKEWAQPALDDLAGRIDAVNEAIRSDFSELTREWPTEAQVKELITEAVAAIELPAPFELSDAAKSEIAQQAAATIPTPKDGESVDMQAVQALVDKAVSSLPPAKDGKSVDAAVIQEMIDAAVTRAVSEITLPVPINGNDGAPGRDAADLEILPSFDPEKSYPRGTYALRNGGLWKTFQRSQGMTGWECIVNGVHKASTEQDTPRGFKAVIELSDGTRSEALYSLPAMIYCGVYKDGTEYKCGDVVTWAGSLWHCNEDTSEKPGIPTAPWTLAAKKGRDGK